MQLLVASGMRNRTVSISIHNLSSNCCLVLFTVPPTVVVFPANRTIVEGSTVILVCTAEGNPTPHVVWIAPNGTILQNRTTDTNLTLANVSRHSSGTYWCNATNELGSDSATAVLDVLCKYLPCESKPDLK